ncbi:hypothetical protein CZ774_11020 [Frigoribacterium sp. JB110]|nr:hypothetical protein CZ774_11020 [Frigoribacterium sp. JB110]
MKCHHVPFILLRLGAKSSPCYPPPHWRAPGFGPRMHERARLGRASPEVHVPFTRSPRTSATVCTG